MTVQQRRRPFAQVDVFPHVPYTGNPVAVVLDGTDLSDQDMARSARWANPSDTTFVLPPSSPDYPALGNYKIGVVGPYPEGSPQQFEVRAFVTGTGGYEDPVTESLNASLAQWLMGTGRAPSSYVAQRGTAMGRRGRVSARSDTQENVWVGGHCTTCISGSVLL